MPRMDSLNRIMNDRCLEPDCLSGSRSCDRDGEHLELKLDQVEIGQAGDRMEIKAVKVNGGA